MLLSTRRVLALLLAALLAASLAACKESSHGDSTKGTTKQERGDTGMHEPM